MADAPTGVKVTDQPPPAQRNESKAKQKAKGKDKKPRDQPQQATQAVKIPAHMTGGLAPPTHKEANVRSKNKAVTNEFLVAESVFAVDSGFIPRNREIEFHPSASGWTNTVDDTYAELRMDSKVQVVKELPIEAFRYYCSSMFWLRAISLKLWQGQNLTAAEVEVQRVFEGKTTENRWYKAIYYLAVAPVKAVVCDQGTSNTKAYNDFGASSVNTPFFMNSKNEKVFTFYDTLHLIKSLRNNFLTHDFIYEGERVSFADVKELYELECKSTTTRAAHQLTPAHIWPNNFQKMNVSLATQVFSHTTSAALKTAVATGQIQSETAEHTAKFLSDINSLYDAMNSRRLKTTNPDSCALSINNQHVMDVIKQGIEIFKNLKKINAKHPRPPCFSGFVTTLTATLQLLNSENCKCLLTSRLNQDPLENLFSSIRQRGGFNRNPSVRVFRGNLRVFTLKQMMEPPKTTSYDPDEDELLEIDTSPEKMSTGNK